MIKMKFKILEYKIETRIFRFLTRSIKDNGAYQFNITKYR